MSSTTGLQALASALAVALWVGPSAAEATGEDPAGEAVTELCLDCHAYMTGDQLPLGDGALPLGVSGAEWEASVHADELGCTSCHRNISDYPHPDLTAADPQAYRREQSETCARCHYAHQTRLLDSIHFAQYEAGAAFAPTCVDCHGAHTISDPHLPRASISQRCAPCHAAVAEAYTSSVHGRALLDDDSPDVPVCTDCHGAHAIADPRTLAFRVAEHQICARCHGDAVRMAPYGLSPNVTTTYLDDFHGRSNQLYAEGAGIPGEPMATCTDCHGVHAIAPFDEEGGPEAVRARVASVCRGCHESVPDAFADAWLYHYEPTLSRAPLVWGVTWVYRLLIPLIMAGLVMHILLHLLHVLRRRAARGEGA